MQDKHYSINVPPNLPMRPHFKSKTFGIKFAIMVYMTSELDFMMFSEIFLDILYLRERFLKKLGGSISFMKYNEKKIWDPILPVQSYREN